jgi:thymidylate synthase ThyX
MVSEREPLWKRGKNFVDYTVELGLDEHVQLPWWYPFPYEAENFDDEQTRVLKKFFTNTDRPIFAIKNLPQEVVGAMFSRYSRSGKSVRRVFLDEFWGSPDLALLNIEEHLREEDVDEEELRKALERTRTFYKTVLAEFGDDSVIQMGSVHIAFEYVSQIAAKSIEDGRVASSYIERSTRYEDFGRKVGGHYLYIEEPTIMSEAPSELRDEFIEWNNALFDAYVEHLPTAIEFFRGKYPIEDQLFEVEKGRPPVPYADVNDERNRRIIQRAYDRALKAKAFDTIRVFLPTTTVTNLGAHFSGQAAESAVHKLMSSPYAEVQLVGTLALQELLKVSPNFLQNTTSYGFQMRDHLRGIRRQQREVADSVIDAIPEIEDPKEVQLVRWDPDADVQVAAQILYDGQARQHKSKSSILTWARFIKDEDQRLEPRIGFSKRLVQLILRSMPDRRFPLNRRHKLPRAFEHANVEVEYNADFGIFRDLQRNRLSLTERQLLSAEEVFVPQEMREPGMESVLDSYLKLAQWTKTLNSRVAKLPGRGEYAAEYVTILGNKLRFNILANLRQWVFFTELRTIPGGHPTYRTAMQETVRQILSAMPWMESLFTHVDWKEDYGLGRLRAELKTQRTLDG